MSPLVALESNKSGSMEAVDFTENNMNNLIEVFWENWKSLGLLKSTMWSVEMSINKSVLNNNQNFENFGQQYKRQHDRDPTRQFVFLSVDVS